MPKMHFYLCSSWECEDDGVMVDPGAPPPQNCFCGKPVITDRYEIVNVDGDDDDDAYPSPTAKGSPRPSWYRPRRRELKERASSPGGTLYCQLCGNEIVVNRDGKEEWTSKSGKKKVTSPHVDHYGSKPIDMSITGGVKGVKGDWIERKTTLRSSQVHMNKLTPDRKQIERDVFNASPLRTTHMTCNCSRPKSRPGGNYPY